MVVVAQLVRALVCGTRGRRFETGLPPLVIKAVFLKAAFFNTHRSSRLCLKHHDIFSKSTGLQLINNALSVYKK